MKSFFLLKYIIRLALIIIVKPLENTIFSKIESTELINTNEINKQNSDLRNFDGNLLKAKNTEKSKISNYQCIDNETTEIIIDLKNYTNISNSNFYLKVDNKTNITLECDQNSSCNFDRSENYSHRIYYLAISENKNLSENEMKEISNKLKEEFKYIINNTIDIINISNYIDYYDDDYFEIKFRNEVDDIYEIYNELKNYTINCELLSNNKTLKCDIDSDIFEPDKDDRFEEKEYNFILRNKCGGNLNFSIFIKETNGEANVKIIVIVSILGIFIVIATSIMLFQSVNKKHKQIVEKKLIDEISNDNNNIF